MAWYEVMSSRQRGPPPGSGRAVNPAYTYGRNGADDREALYNESHGDRGYLTPRGGRETPLDQNDSPMSNQYAYRPRTESNVSIVSNSSDSRRNRMPIPAEDSRGRGSSVSSSPGPVFRDDGRPRSGQSNYTAQPRDKYYSSTEYQPPQFPQDPYGNARNSSMSIDSQDSSGRRSRPTSRTQSPVPPFPPTPPPQPHRFDNSSPSRRPPTSNNRPPQEQESRSTENPYQLAPLKFSPPRNRDSSGLLAGTAFDDFLVDDELVQKSPPAPLRPPPPPPRTHPVSSPRTNVDQPRPPQQSPLSRTFTESDVLRRSPNQDGTDEEWTLDNVIEFLRQNQFGENWQQAFREADIHGDKFRACANYPEARRLLSIPQEAHKARNQANHSQSLFKLITTIRKVLNPDSDTPDSEGSAPIRPAEPPRQSSDHKERAKEQEKVISLASG